MSGQKAAGKQAPDDTESEGHVDEKTPLKAEENKGAGGIDAEKLLAESLKIRLPRMDKEMKFGYPAERKRKDKGALKKDPNAKSDTKKVAAKDLEKAQGAGTVAATKAKDEAMVAAKKAQDEATAAAKKEAYEAVKDFLPDGKIPTKQKLIRWLKKYIVDFITNSIYGGVGILLTFLFADQVAQACQCSGYTNPMDGLGGLDCHSIQQGKAWCYVNTGSCTDGVESSNLKYEGVVQQWSFSACASVANATEDAVKDLQNQMELLKNQTDAAITEAQHAVNNIQAQVKGLENKLTEYWVIIAGCASSMLMIMKNVRFIVRSFYDLIDKIEDKINAGIDVLQKELEEDVTEVLEDATESMPDDQMSAMGRKVMVRGVVNKLKTAIDDAQEHIPEQLESLLPWVVRVKCRFVFVLAGPCVLVAAVKCAWDLYGKFSADVGIGVTSLTATTTTMASSSTVNTTIFANTTLTANSGGRRLDVVAELEEHLNSLYPMFVTLFLNFLFAVFSSDPVVRLMTNTAIRLIERATNWFILKVAKEKVPLDEIQTALDYLALGSGFDAKSMRQCTKNCGVGHCNIQ